MAQNITVQGASYADVPAVVLPKTGGGTASFTDVSDTTAAAGDVASGKYFYTAAGVKTEGTASGGGGGRSLPPEYQEVEYIYGSATGAAIDTGVIPTATTSAVIKVKPLIIDGTGFFGTNGTGEYADWRLFNYSGVIYWDVYNVRYSGSGSNPLQVMPVDTIREIALANTYIIDIPTSSLAMYGVGGNYANPLTYPIYINGISGASPHASQCVWYYVKIYSDIQTIVRDFVPCYRKSDDVVGMYDLVKGTFYTSVLGGDFVAGPDVVTTSELLSMLEAAL